ncbi:hypothetical protein Tco_0117021 [Tanacetum coccineum]
MMERELGEGYSFIKKKCFVCGSLSHLIKDCDYYEKKMAREAEFKKQRVFNTGNRVEKPVWTNANRVNHANQFVPRSVQLNAGRPNINSVRPNINTGRTNVNSVRPNKNISKQPVPTNNTNSFSPVRPQGNWGTAVKTSVGYNWRRPRTKSNYNSGSNLVRTDHPLKNLEDRGIFDSGCSGHMTGNKDHLDDFEECKGGLFYLLEHKVLFTETEYFVVSPDFKMPDENQILLNVPRQNNLYSFDMKEHLSHKKYYACLIAKPHQMNSKFWHRRTFCLEQREYTNKSIAMLELHSRWSVLKANEQSPD